MLHESASSKASWHRPLCHSCRNLNEQEDSCVSHSNAGHHDGSLLLLFTASIYAAPGRVEALISTKTETRLDFADGSKRYLVAIQREGKATGSAPLAGATMLEWGVHDVIPGVGIRDRKSTRLNSSHG